MNMSTLRIYMAVTGMSLLIGFMFSCDIPNNDIRILNPYQNVNWTTVEHHKAGLHDYTLQSQRRQPGRDYNTIVHHCRGSYSDTHSFDRPQINCRISHPANHGTSNPYDINIPLIAAVPDIKQGVKSQVPTGNIDLAPTVCYLLGIKPTPSMQGRILYELLRTGPDPESVNVDEQVITADVELENPNIKYQVEVWKLQVDQTEYLHFSNTQRIYENSK